MTKTDLIEVLSVKEKLPVANASRIINLLFERFADALKTGDRIEIRGFGSFTVRAYNSYMGRNPKTGSRTEVKPKRLPFFKVGKELKARVNG